MKKYLKILFIYLAFLFCFSGVVSSADTVQAMNNNLPGTSVSTTGTLLGLNGDPLIGPRIFTPDTDELNVEPDMSSPEEYKIFGWLDAIQDHNNLDTKYRGQFRILSYSLGAGNAATGTANNNYLKITKYLSDGSERILQACISGQHIRDLKLTVLRSRDPEEKLFYIRMYDLQVASYNTITDNENPENTIEEICFKFVKIEYEQTVYKDDGTSMPPVKFIYDYKLGRFL